MRLNKPKLLHFAGKFLLFLILFALIWPFIVSGYNKAAVRGADQFLAFLQQPALTIQVNEAGDVQVHRRDNVSSTLIFTIEGSYLNLIYFNFILLLALLLATPNVKILKLLQLIPVGLAILFAIHILSLVVIVRAEFIAHYNPQNYFYNWIYGFFGTGAQLFAVLIWGSLTFCYWLPRPGIAENSTVKRKAKKTN